MGCSEFSAEFFRMERVITMHMRFLAATAAAGALLAANGASAATVAWTQWTGQTDTGVSGAIGVTYVGDTIGTEYNNPSWDPSSTFKGGTVSNAPTPEGGYIVTIGGTSRVNTVTFSSTVANPVMAIYSLGRDIEPASFVFTTSNISLEAGGPSVEYDGSSITLSGNTVTGVEGNGVIQFNGLVNSISWTNPQEEYTYGFTVGTPGVAAGVAGGVPEPATWAMMLTGFAGLGATLRRRRALELA